MADEIKFPLSKKLKDQYSDDYEKIFYKRPVHNIKDEKLVEIVNSNRDKITPDAKTTEQPSQEGIQDEETQTNEGAGDSNESGTENGSVAEQISNDLKNGEFVGVNPEAEKAAKEREFQFNQYAELYGEEANGELSTDEVTAANVTKLNYNTSVKVYFDLFGKRPLEEMTKDQINSAIENEEQRISKAKAAAAKNTTPAVSEFDYDPETQMLIVRKSDRKDKRVINKNTFDFLKGDFDAVSELPKELKNRD